MAIEASQVKELREKTGVGMMECKQALVEAGGDLAGAEKLLRMRGLAAAQKKSGRATGEGLVEAYVHTGGKIGVLLEVNCETDFAARSDDFRQLVRSLAMHIAAAAPRYLKRDEVASEVLAEEREIATEQARKAGKPDNVIERIVTGRIEKFFAENCLLEQPFVKEPERTVTQIIGDAVSRIGENIQVRRYTRYVLGDPA